MRIALPIIVLIASIIAIYYAKNYGYNKGVERGVNVALDTVNKLLRNAVDKKDSCITRLIINDTLIYNISYKTIK